MLNDDVDKSWESWFGKDVKPIKASEFKPYVYYNSDGNLLDCALSPRARYSKPIDKNILVHYDMDTNEIVGFEICGLLDLFSIEDIEKMLKDKRKNGRLSKKSN